MDRVGKGKFHRVCGKHIKLSEGNTVAERVRSYNEGVVYTEQPVPLGTMFEIKVHDLELEHGYLGFLALGFTTIRPDTIGKVPADRTHLRRDKYYWTTGFRNSVGKGKSFGCRVYENGNMHRFVDGEDQGLSHRNLPTDQPLWGFVDIYGQAKKIESEYYVPHVHRSSNYLQLEQQMQQLRDEASEDFQHHVQGLQQQFEKAEARRQESQLQLQAPQKRLQEAAQQLKIVAAREESQLQLEGLRQSLDEAAQQLQLQREIVAQQREEAAVKEQEYQLQLQGLQQRLDEAVQQNQEVMQQLDQQGTEAAAREQESQLQLQLLQQRLDTATAELEQLRSSPQVISQQGFEAWKVPRNDVQILGEIDRGAWGVVAKGRFQGQLVAVKWPHPAILNEHTTERLRREVQIMAQVRHPNLLRFIAAVFDDQMPRLPPLIVMELLDTNLRAAYQNGRLSGDSKIPIFRDVAYALHYLHEHQEPIIHRDVSAPNVLLEELPNQMWRAKVSDFGSANLAKMAQTMGEGAIIYAAPETIPQTYYDSDDTPPPQTTKIDVFSYGVLLCEVITCQLPDPAQYQSTLRQIQSQWQFMHELIVICTKRNPEERPTMAQVLDKLNKLPRPRPQQRS